MEDEALSRLAQAKFWILLILSIPSIICSILIFIYFYHKRRQISIDHHLIILLVTTSFLQLTTDIPFVIDYYRHDTVLYGSYSFCTWWNWWEYSSNAVLLFGMAWCSIERHILVFHRTILNTKRQRILFHFLPLSIFCLYPSIFYFVVMVFNSCQNEWNYDIVFCLLPCYLTDQPALALYDFLGNVVCPILIITTANVGLIYRVFRQKRRHHTTWHRQYKLVRQLVSIAVIYVVFWFPLTFNGLIMTFVPSSISEGIQVNYFFFLLHLVSISLPFISVSLLSDFTKIVFKRQEGTVAPVVTRT